MKILIHVNMICATNNFNILLLILIILTSHLCASEVSDNLKYDIEIYPIVTVAQGQLRGLQRTSTSGKTFYSFKGVPFAKPPVGFQRFKDPIPPLPWSDVYNAFEDGNICAQVNVYDGSFHGSEDCLFLNIFTPSLPAHDDKKYPVLIYIHGGGLSQGNGLEAIFNPAVYLDKEIIVVSIQYRLGIFGFLSLDIPDVPGNAALKDQLMAIKWVNKNIVNFNGNTTDVTLYGISAGSGSIEFQLLNTKSEGLFHKVIMSSGSTLTSWATQRNKTKILEKLSKVMGVNNEPFEILNALMDKETRDILSIAISANDPELRKTGSIYTQFVAAPEMTFLNVDSFLTNFPLESFKIKNYLNVPTLTTFCKDEGNMFAEIYGEHLMKEMLDRKYDGFVNFVNITDPSAFNGNLTNFYSSMNISEEIQAHEFLSDLMFLSGIYKTLKYFSLEPSNAPPNYSYLFSFAGNHTIGLPIPVVGSTPHVMDAAYLFGYLDGLMSEEEIQMKSYLSTIHTDFIKYGNPTISGNISWNPVNEGQMNVLNIGSEEDHRMIPFPFSERMEYWNSLFV